MIRTALAARLRDLVGSGQMDLSRPPGDPGLFAPGSPAWRVHGDFSAMMIGGISALLLQMLHPLALAGVWDHSRFRDDRIGRLRRTARFIATTTFGSTASAEAAIDAVRRVHDRVHGTLPDGTPYDANDPALLTWVHVAEMDSFARAFRRYGDTALSMADEDRYFDETAIVAMRLGAADVPRSRAAIETYYARIRPALRADHRVREVAAALLAPGGRPATDFGMRLASSAALDLLPDWAQRLHGRNASLATPAVRVGAQGMGRVVRWALRRR